MSEKNIEFQLPDIPKSSNRIMKLKPLKRDRFSIQCNKNNFLPQLYVILDLSKDELEIVGKLNYATPGDPSEFRVSKEKNEDSNDVVVSAASIVQLFLLLTNPESSLEYQRQYLTTYICYSRSELLLAMLATRYFIDTNAEGVNVKKEEEKIQIRNRIIRVIATWINMVPKIFNDELIMGLRMLQESIMNKDVSEEQQSNQYKILKSEINKLTGNSVKTVKTKREMPEPILPKTKEEKWTSIQCFAPEEVARQVSLIYSDLFRKIKLDELLQGIWFCNKEGTKNIQELTHCFDVFSGYVTLSVLLGDTPKARASTFKFWIDVGAEFEKLNNFHGMFAVDYGLLHPAVKRLTKTMKIVEKTNATRKANFERMNQICDFGSDYKVYRSVIKKSVEPCVPFIGCFQKDLIYIQESYPNKIDGLINFKKCIDCYKLMKTIQNYQNFGYYFKPIPKLQQMILGLNEPAETTEIIQLSIKKEKKVTK